MTDIGGEGQLSEWQISVSSESSGTKLFSTGMTWTKKLMPPEMNEAKNSFFALEERERDRKVDQWTNLRLAPVVLFGGRFLLKSKK